MFFPFDAQCRSVYRIKKHYYYYIFFQFIIIIALESHFRIRISSSFILFGGFFPVSRSLHRFWEAVILILFFTYIYLISFFVILSTARCAITPTKIYAFNLMQKVALIIFHNHITPSSVQSSTHDVRFSLCAIFIPHFIRNGLRLN